MTRNGFCDALRVELQRIGYAWTADPVKLEAAIELTRQTIGTRSNTVSLDGPAYRAAWHAIGGKGTPTYTALRALPSS